MPTNKKFADVPVREKLDRITGWIEEKKGKDILALDLSRINTFTEGIIIVTASSIRHGQGLADHILAQSKAERYEFLRMEGFQTGQWILLDMNDLVISIFQKETRELYRLEDLWKNAETVADTREHAPALI
ncbi:MAG: ribosome silencing factor [Deltaproteobacteria bacterium]|nr:ribosome silencing factor [Deltaproteobacteria bacterium]